MTNRTFGSRWLLPVTIDEIDTHYVWVRTPVRENAATLIQVSDIPFLIPADRITQLEAENVRLREACLGVTACLTATIWFLKKGGKKAAASDKLFEAYLADYERSLDAARAVLSKLEVD